MKQNDKKTVILSTQPISKGHTAFVRISKFIVANINNVEILDEDFERYTKPIDNLIIVYGTFYADFKNIMRMLNRYKDNTRFFYMINEYGLVPNGDVYRFLIKNNYGVIANYVESSQGAKHYSNYHVANLNVSAIRDITMEVPFEKKYIDLIYWGRHRPDREIYFREYLKDCTLSTSLKNQDKFDFVNDKNVKVIDTIDFTENSLLKQCKFTIYVEDVYTHTHFNHLGDRFYEALSFGLIMFFDEHTRNNVKLSGYNIDDFYFVQNYNQLLLKMEEVKKNPEQHIEYFRQLREDALKEREKVLNGLVDIFNEPIKQPDKICTNCSKPAFNLFKCDKCNRVICPNCVEINKKFYCNECATLLNLIRVDNQMTFE